MTRIISAEYKENIFPTPDTFRGVIVVRYDDDFTVLVPSNGPELIDDKPVLKSVADDLRQRSAFSPSDS